MHANKRRFCLTSMATVLALCSFAGTLATAPVSSALSTPMPSAQPAVADIAKISSSKHSDMLNAFVEKYGWDTKDFFWEDAQLYPDGYFKTIKGTPEETRLKEEQAAINKASKAIGLPGFKYAQEGVTAHFAVRRSSPLVDNTQYYYSDIWVFTDSLNKNKILASYIGIHYDMGPGENFLPLCTPDELSDKAEAFAAKNTAKPSDKTAALDFFGGWRVESDGQNALAKIFAKTPWKAVKFNFFYAHSQGDAPLLGKAEFRTALLASQKGGIKLNDYYQKLLEGKNPFTEPRSESTAGAVSEPVSTSTSFSSRAYVLDSNHVFYLYYISYSEQRYKLKSGKYYYVDFCADYGMLPMENAKSKVETKATYAFLIVKPGKKNAQGTLDRFFYPITTKPSTLEADMKLYFEGKSPKNNVSLPK